MSGWPVFANWSSLEWRSSSIVFLVLPPATDFRLRQIDRFAVLKSAYILLCIYHHHHHHHHPHLGQSAWS
eukprot:4063546-Karenia_brevis.AAC.1